jgi:hypothetical protein
MPVFPAFQRPRQEYLQFEANLVSIDPASKKKEALVSLILSIFRSNTK